MIRTALSAFLATGLALAAAGPVCAEPVENGTEIAQLLETLGDRCWAVDIDGEMLDAAALSEAEGPMDIELECVIGETAVKATRPLASNVI